MGAESVYAWGSGRRRASPLGIQVAPGIASADTHKRDPRS